MADRAMKQLKAQISRARKRRRVVAASIHLDAQCIVCGTWYKLSGPAQGSGRRTCSDKCKRIRTPRESKEAKRARDRKRYATQEYRDKERERNKRRAEYKAAYNAAHKDRQAQRDKERRAKQGGGIVSKDCEHCGETYTGIARSMAEREYCSRRCTIDARRIREREERIANNLRANRNCLHCGSAVPATMRSHAVYCSRKCLALSHKATRKALIRMRSDGAVTHIPRAYIIERDNSRCHMCRKKCKREEIHLDHVIPLSKGGTHTLENLRVACAPCNLSKGDRECNEQLMLVG